jgi:hypothetical protein
VTELFQKLLVPALDRTFAFAEMNAVTMFVGQNLDLYMSRAFDVTLDVNGASS